jgi:hypothetical protein
MSVGNVGFGGPKDDHPLRSLKANPIPVTYFENYWNKLLPN